MSTAHPAILPHTKAKGIDMCGGASPDLYIIRSDLNCYMKQYYDKESDSTKCEVYPLHPAFNGCDHYIYNSTKKPGGIGPSFIVIKNSKFLRVGSTLSTINRSGVEATDGEPLSSAMSNGENYCYDGKNYYKFYNGGTECVAAPSLTSDNTTHYSVPASCQNGLYYYGYFQPNYRIGTLTVNPFGVVNRWMSSNMESTLPYFMFYNVVNFLPGGLAFSYGSPIHGWQLLKSFKNSSNAKLSWSAAITKTIGSSLSAFQSLQQNWSVTKNASIGTAFEKDFFIKASVQAQFSLSTQYGGASVQTSQADWNEQQSVTEKVEIDVGPGETAYVWQYRLGFAGMPNSFLYCRDIAITNSNTPPQDGMLPEAFESLALNDGQEESTRETPKSADAPLACK